METRFSKAWHRWLRGFGWTVQSTSLLAATIVVPPGYGNTSPHAFVGDLVAELVGVTAGVLVVSLFVHHFPAHHWRTATQINPQDKPTLVQYFSYVLALRCMFALAWVGAYEVAHKAAGGEWIYSDLALAKVGISTFWVALLIVLLSWRRVSRQAEGVPPQWDQTLSP